MENLKKLIENNTIVVVDLETSGLDKNRDYIIEIGAVKIKNGIICDKYTTLVNSIQLESLQPEVERLTGITYEQLKSAPFVDEVLQKHYEFSKGCVLVAHNLSFHFAFLRNWGFWCGVSFDEFEKDAIDTVDLAKQILGDKVKNYKLSTLTNYFNIEFTQQRTLDYAETVAKILLELAAFVP